MNAEFINALNELEEEKGISKEVLLDAIKTALVAAYKRDFACRRTRASTSTRRRACSRSLQKRRSVDDVFDDTFEISLEDARKINMAYELGDIIEEEVTPSSFGRIAAAAGKAGGRAAHP